MALSEFDVEEMADLGEGDRGDRDLGLENEDPECVSSRKSEEVVREAWNVVHRLHGNHELGHGRSKERHVLLSIHRRRLPGRLERGDREDDHVLAAHAPVFPLCAHISVP